MRVAAKPRCAVLVLMFLALGMSLGLPTEDVPETAYNESEGLPYEGTSLFSIVVPLVAARTTRALLGLLHLKHGAPSLLPSARVRNGDAHRSADARVSLALLCTLLC